MQSQRGFTLIEILIVMAIIAIVAAFVTLNVTGWGLSRKIDSLSYEITVTLQFAEEQALLEPAELGLVFFKNGYQFYRQVTDTKSGQLIWEPIKEGVLSFHEISDDIGIELRVNNKLILPADRNERITPSLRISSSGNLSPFKLFIGPKDKPASYLVFGNFSGQVTREALETDPLLRGAT